MQASKISSKFRVVIPKKIREQFNLQPGQKLVFIPYKNSLWIVAVPPIKNGYGFLKGIDTSIERANNDRV
jgi:AbrB family looped-hinge helix DNA binding protein